MVGPISDAERISFYRKLRVGVAVLVGLSGGLITLQTETTALESGGAVAAGLVVGWALAWFVLPNDSAVAERRESPVRERTFADGDSEEGSRGGAGDADEPRRRRRD